MPLQLSVFSYSIPFTASIRVRGLVQTNRSGFIIAISTVAGDLHYGEVAPLPGVHKEDLGTALCDLNTARKYLQESPLKLADFRWDQPYFGLCPQLHSLVPSVICGLEQAFLSLARHQGIIPMLGEIASSGRQYSIASAGLLQIAVEKDPKDLAVELRQMLDHGMRSLKVKVGLAPPEAEVRWLEQLQTEVGGHLGLRLDANESLELSQLAPYFAAWQTIGGEYFEEPVADLTAGQWRALGGQAIPLARDEWFWQHGAAADPEAQVYVLKPQRIGGLSATVRWLKHARERGARVVLSSCYETGISMLSYAYLCHAFALQDADMGFGAYAYLGVDVLAAPLKLSPGTNNIEWPAAGLSLTAARTTLLDMN